MSQFFDSLESRMFLSASAVTKATLTADAQQLTQNASSARASLKAAAAQLNADVKAISADVKAISTPQNRKANAGLLKLIKADQAKAVAKVKSDAAILLATGGRAAQRAIADAKALLAHPSNAKLQAKVAADVTALAGGESALLALQQQFFNSLALPSDLAALANANPSGASLATDVRSAQIDASNLVTSYLHAGQAYSNQLGAVAADAALTSTGSSFPNLVGTFSGSQRAATGANLGRVLSLSLQITSEGKDGSLAGTATISKLTGPVTLNLTGSVTAGSTFSATLVDPANAANNVTLTATVNLNVPSGGTNHTVLDGHYTDANGSETGDFTILM